MSLRAKTLLIVALLVAFALWPLAHRAVVHEHFVSPWRLFGWAMYCVPVYKPRVELFIDHGGERVQIAFPRTSANNVRTFDTFIRNRAELGTLVDVDDLGRVLFREYPQLDQVTVRITQPVYHYDSDQIRSAYFEHVLDRID
ncbi:MAG: hypothetical protein GY719_36270 [bacterium]|nr:hypothetical protein [bacterium]